MRGMLECKDAIANRHGASDAHARAYFHVSKQIRLIKPIRVDRPRDVSENNMKNAQMSTECLAEFRGFHHGMDRCLFMGNKITDLLYCPEIFIPRGEMEQQIANGMNPQLPEA
jgi:hypothetical protein